MKFNHYFVSEMQHLLLVWRFRKAQNTLHKTDMTSLFITKVQSECEPLSGCLCFCCRSHSLLLSSQLITFWLSCKVTTPKYQKLFTFSASSSQKYSTFKTSQWALTRYYLHLTPTSLKKDHTKVFFHRFDLNWHWFIYMKITAIHPSLRLVILVTFIFVQFL